MLSGDKKSIVDDVAEKLNMNLAYGDLLPEDKVYHIQELKKDKDNLVVFVGDGINDARHWLLVMWELPWVVWGLMLPLR